MTFVERAIVRAGLGEVRSARAKGDLELVSRLVAGAGDVDLLVLGAVADAVRATELGHVVRIHLRESVTSARVRWIFRGGRSELELLRAVATARITGPHADRIGVDWGEHGLELAQVALGFGATDLTGPITRKSGALIGADDLRKVKGQGMVAAAALRRHEISALVGHAGRACEFADEPARPEDGAVQEAPHA